jgi:hypothetical protein
MSGGSIARATERRAIDRMVTAWSTTLRKHREKLSATYLAAFDRHSIGQQWAARGHPRCRRHRRPGTGWREDSAPPSHNRNLRAGSSVGQSSGLIIRRSQVRVLPGPSHGQAESAALRGGASRPWATFWATLQAEWVPHLFDHAKRRVDGPAGKCRQAGRVSVLTTSSRRTGFPEIPASKTALGSWAPRFRFHANATARGRGPRLHASATRRPAN